MKSIRAKKIYSVAIVILWLATAAISFAGCGVQYDLESVAFDAPAYTLAPGDTRQTGYIVEMARGENSFSANVTLEASGRSVDASNLESAAQRACERLVELAPIYESSNEMVLEVDDSGVMTALASGTAVVRITLGEGEGAVTAEAQVTVVVPVASVQAEEAALTLVAGKTAELKAHVLPTNATVQTLAYESSAPAVVSVDGSGLAIAIAAGRATITITSTDPYAAEPVSTAVEITVAARPEGIELDKTEAALAPDGTIQLVATLLPDTIEKDAIKLIWMSDDDSVAKVNDNGLVTAIARGTATITVAVEGFEEEICASCSVTVRASGGISDKDSSSNASGNSTGGNAGGSSGIAYELLTLVNGARQGAGLNPVSWSAELEAACTVRAAELVLSFSHTRPDGSSCFTASSLARAENIAAGYTSAQDVFNGWMNSEGHRNNIMNPEYTIMGVGYVYDSSGGYAHYWCQMFG